MRTPSCLPGFPPTLGSVVKVSGRRKTQGLFSGTWEGNSSAVAGASVYTSGCQPHSWVGGRGCCLPCVRQVRQWRHPEGKVTLLRSPASWASPAPSGPSTLRRPGQGLAPTLGGWLGAEAGCPRNPPHSAACALVLQSTDSAAWITAGWKVWKCLSLPAHSLGLSVAIC